MNQTTEIERVATHDGSLFSWLDARIVERESAGGYARLRLDPSSGAPPIGAGQFILLRAAGRSILPRAFSPAGADEAGIELLIKVDGLVREELAGCPLGTRVEIRGPYGIPITDRIRGDRRYLLAGGGSGVAPLLHFRAQHPDRVAGAVFGFRPAGVERLLPGENLVIEERDGRLADADAVAMRGPQDGLIACGPEAMLASLARRYRNDPHLFVSLETRIGCGIGACLGCSIETTAGMRRVCKDGPVFAAEELPWLG